MIVIALRGGSRGILGRGGGSYSMTKAGAC